MSPEVMFPLIMAGCTLLLAILIWVVRDPDLDPRARRLGGIGFVFVALGFSAFARYEWFRGLLWPYDSPPTLLTAGLLSTVGVCFMGRALLAMAPDEVPQRTRKAVESSFYLVLAGLVGAILSLLGYLLIGQRVLMLGICMTSAVIASAGVLIGGSVYFLRIHPIIRAKRRERRAQRRSGV